MSHKHAVLFPFQRRSFATGEVRSAVAVLLLPIAGLATVLWIGFLGACAFRLLLSTF